MAKAPTGEAPPADPPKVPRDPTTYVVLERVDAAEGRTAWAVFKQVKAANQDAALKAATTEPGKDGEDATQTPGTFKAVALSAWKGGETYANKSTVVTETTPYSDADEAAAPPLRAVAS